MIHPNANDTLTVRSVFIIGPDNKVQAHPHLPGQHRPQLRRDPPRHRLAAAHRQLQGRHPGQLEGRRRRHHRRRGLRRRGQGAVPQGLDHGQALPAGAAPARTTDPPIGGAPSTDERTPPRPPPSATLGRYDNQPPVPSRWPRGPSTPSRSTARATARCSRSTASPSTFDAVAFTAIMGPSGLRQVHAHALRSPASTPSRRARCSSATPTCRSSTTTSSPCCAATRSASSSRRST